MKNPLVQRRPSLGVHGAFVFYIGTNEDQRRFLKNAELSPNFSTYGTMSD
jgi:hypothetical protein